MIFKRELMPSSPIFKKKGCQSPKFSKSLENIVLGKQKEPTFLEKIKMMLPQKKQPVFVQSCIANRGRPEWCQCVGKVGESVTKGALDKPYETGVIGRWREAQPAAAKTLSEVCGQN